MPMPSWLPVLLGFLTAVGPVSTDMYLPAFPAIEQSLGGWAGSAQITLATWFAGLAVGQITQGTLSDRFGRRAPLLLGTAIYTLASVGCALAPGLASLSVLRFVAAFGGSAGMVIPRAIVRDLSDGHAAVRLMSRLMLVMGVTPILAPTLGGLVLSVASWRVIFWAGAAYGLVCAGLVWRLLPDTLPRANRVRLGLGGLLNRYLAIGRERGFITHAMMGGCGLFSMFAYLGGSPAVFITLFRLSPPQYGMLFGANAFFYIMAAQLNARLVPRFGSARTLAAAAAAFLVSTAAAAGVAWAQVGNLFATLLPLTAMWASLGFLTPNAAVGALSRHAPHAASASALMGTLQFGLGAASGTLVGLLDDGTARPMATLLLLGAAGAMVANAYRPRPSSVKENPA
jgi:MFS transporter, DHA1 family, multidrug resistance protein